MQMGGGGEPARGFLNPKYYVEAFALTPPNFLTFSFYISTTPPKNLGLIGRL